MSRLGVSLIFVCVLLMAVGFAIPKPDDQTARTLEKKLSEKEHYTDGNHNTDYDHEAFLGEEEAKTFEDLTPEQSRDRLGKIVDKMDLDGDGLVEEEELKAWIRLTQKRYISDDVQRQWKAHNPADDVKLTWDEYRKSSFGFVDDSPENDVVEEDGYSYRDLMRRDQRRWTVADANNDGHLSKEEFTDFLHPEEAGTRMRDIVVLETMEDIDKDKDGKVSLDEYIGDMYRGNPGETEPDWVRSEREQFSQYRDKNGDGYMDQEEVRGWIIPPDYDHAEAEAKHLIFESDKDKDKLLTKDEIINKYDLFVGSQATDFGEALTRHDEF